MNSGKGPSRSSKAKARSGAKAATEGVIEALLMNAAPNSVVTLPKGTFTAEIGTTIVVRNPVTIKGNGATLVNYRLIFLADVSLTDVTFLEKDCVFHSNAPDVCTPAPPLVTVGYPGFPIAKANLQRIKMDFGRAYSGIVFGLDRTENVTIDDFTIVDNEMSAITAFGGRNIRIANGRMRGGDTGNVDDGVALYAVYDELHEVVVENIQADNVFDAVGIGALMYKPLSDVLVRNITCNETAVCIYVKAGDQAPVPAGYTSYSELSKVDIRGVTDSDSAGKRYLSSIWIFAKGGATAQDITISDLRATSRALLPNNARIKVFTDAESRLANVTIADAEFVDAHRGAAAGPSVPGHPLTEGIFIQSLGTSGISELRFEGVQIDGATHYAVDSVLAQVNGLYIQRSEFHNMNTVNKSGPLFLIPYSFLLDGATVQAQ